MDDSCSDHPTQCLDEHFVRLAVHLESHGVIVPENAGHTDPHILGGQVSHVVLLSDGAVNLAHEKHRDQYDQVNDAIEEVLPIQVDATKSQVLRAISLSSQRSHAHAKAAADREHENAICQ